MLQTKSFKFEQFWILSDYKKVLQKKVLQFVQKEFTICLSLNSRLALSTAAARPCHNFEIARIGIECPMYSWLADVNHQSSTNPRGTQPISTNKLKVPHHYHQTNMNPNQSNIKSSALLSNYQTLQMTQYKYSIMHFWRRVWKGFHCFRKCFVST